MTLVHFCSRLLSSSSLFLVSSLCPWHPCTFMISPSFPFPSCLLVFVSSCLLLTLLSGKSSFPLSSCLWVLVPTLHPCPSAFSAFFPVYFFVHLSLCLHVCLTLLSFLSSLLFSCLLDTFVLLLSHLLYPFHLVYVSSCLLDTFCAIVISPALSLP